MNFLSRATRMHAVVVGVLVAGAAPSAVVAQGSGASGRSGEGLDEVVVTARKREESLQSVPVAVSAFSVERLQRLQAVSLGDLSYRVPNLGITKNQTTPASAQLYLRGIGQDDSTPTFEPGVGVYVDGVYFARLQGSLLDLGDFERVEVLRGPQGTLYGRNSSGGAISFVTRKPSLTETSLGADITLGKFNRFDLKGVVSMPLVEGKIGAKLELLSRDQDGYMTRRSDGQDINRIDRQAARLSLRWQLSDRTTADFSADYTRDRSGMQAPTPLVSGGSLPGNTRPQFGYYISDSDVPDFNEFDGGGVSAVVTWDLGDVELKSTTAWRNIRNDFWGDLRGRALASGFRSALQRNLQQSQWTQELQLTSTGESRLSWVTGAFFLREKIHNVDTLARLHDYEQTATSLAAYGEVTFDVTDAFSVTAGGRYTTDEKKYALAAISGGGVPFRAASNPDFSEFTPKLGAAYQFSGGPLLYATWQKGFKAGAIPGFPQRAEDATNAVLPPEKVESVELGVKADWLDGKLRTNFAYFDSSYTDLQLTVRNTATGILESRSADADLRGFELEFEARPIDQLSISGAIGTLDAEYTRSTAATASARVGAGFIKFAPELQWNLGLEWRQPLQGGTLKLAANYLWTDDVYLNAAINPVARQESHELVDASLRYESDRGWFVAAGLQNATDVQWASTGTTDPVAGALWAQPPRTWSVTLGYRN